MADPSVADRRQTLSVIETAAFLGVSKQLIYRMVKDRRLPARRIGDRVLIDRTTVEALLGRPLPVR